MLRFTSTLIFLIIASVSFLGIQADAVNAQGTQDLADVIEKSERSVVRIEVKGKKGDSLGSGFVVESTGVFVTNVHVLAGAQEATATFANGKSVEIEGTYYWDETRDICIAQLAGDDYPTIDISTTLPRKGETVTALGAPQGLSFTATNGIVSALRKGKNIRPTLNGSWVQIDAALSPGNSGGPLINRFGKVIAMSTLASTGRSQNLNFGISAIDIDEALEESRDFDLQSLRDGIGEVETDSGEGGPSGEAIIARPPVPVAAVEDYVQECREEYTDLARDIRRKASEADKEYRLRKRGEVGIPGRRGTEVLVVMTGKNRKFYFSSDRVKEREVRQHKQIASELKDAKNSLGKEVSDESLHVLLQHAGLYLDTTDDGSVGFMTAGRMVHPYNDHDAVIEFDNKPYLMWMPTTSGMAAGAPINPTTVYVAGTQTVEVPGQSTMSVTLLVALKDSELKKAVFGADAVFKKKSENGMRTWTAGKHSVEAELLGVTADKVKLRKANGKEVSVPKSILSKEDRDYLKSQE
jgi:S1-C subfamily serine protease